jgi:hypothetical protein
VPSYIFDEDVVRYSSEVIDHALSFDQYRRLSDEEKWDYVYNCLQNQPLHADLYRRAARNAIQRACNFFIEDSKLMEISLSEPLITYLGSDETEGVRFFPRLYAYKLSPREKAALPRTGVRFRPWTPQEYFADASPEALNGFLRWSYNADNNASLKRLFSDLGLWTDHNG